MTLPPTFIGTDKREQSFSFIASFLFVSLVLILAAVLSAMVDEILSTLFITVLIFEFCEHFKISPVKLVVASVFAINIGSSWLAHANPVGIGIFLNSGSFTH
jgi:Na+/H+ antiporter NhaD/arsenite permease-like protein